MTLPVANVATFLLSIQQSGDFIKSMFVYDTMVGCNSMLYFKS